MRKGLTSTRSPAKTIEISGQDLQYQFVQDRCLANIQIASQCGTSNQTKARFTRKSKRYEIIRNQHKNYKEIFTAQLLSQMFQNRKRYSFQMIKLLYMFPDDSFSQNISVNSYDRLFFHDEHVHTMIKIYQTKQLQAKIWAFLNLKDLHKRQKLQKFTTKIENVHRKLQKKMKKASFDQINQYSIKIKPDKNITVQKLPPIQTKISPRNQTKIIKIQSDQSLKTQKIERTNITKTATDDVIRISTYQSSPLVTRIQLQPQNPGIKVIYPSSTLNTMRNVLQRDRVEIKQSRSETNIHRPELQTHRINLKQGQTKIIYPSRIITQQSRYTSQSRPVITSNETIRRIEPVQIRTAGQTYYTKPQVVSYDSRQQTRRYTHSQQPVVHTVNGDCTINIHNGCTHESGHQVQIHKNRQCHSQSKQASIHTPTMSQASTCHCCQPTMPTVHFVPAMAVFNMGNHHCCHNSCHYQQCMPSFQCQCNRNHFYSMANLTTNCGCSQTCSSSNSNSNTYFIQDRIQYLKYLEQMNRKLELSKLGRKN